MGDCLADTFLTPLRCRICAFNSFSYSLSQLFTQGSEESSHSSDDGSSSDGDDACMATSLSSHFACKSGTFSPEQLLVLRPVDSVKTVGIYMSNLKQIILCYLLI